MKCGQWAVRRRSLLMERGYDEEKHHAFRWPICMGGREVVEVSGEGRGGAGR